MSFGALLVEVPATPISGPNKSNNVSRNIFSGLLDFDIEKFPKIVTL